MRTLVAALLFAPFAAGCHLASGIDAIKIDRRVAEVPTEEFFCEPLKDEFEELNGGVWSVSEGDGYNVAHDPSLEAVVVSMGDVAAGSRGGLRSVLKHDFNNCWIIVEVDPGMDENTFAMVALFEEPDDEIPLVAIRKEGSTLIASRDDEDLQSIPFNEELRFWRVAQEGEQIIFDASLRGQGSWEPVGAVTKPFEARAVHIGLYAGAPSAVTTDAVSFLYYGMKEEP